MEKIKFFHSEGNDVEIIYLGDSQNSYSIHTHVSHYTIGFVLNGTIKVEQQNEISVCSKEEIFAIPPNKAHSIYDIGGNYSMLSICLDNDFVEKNDMNAVLRRVENLSNDLIEKELITSDQVNIIIDDIAGIYHGIVGVFTPLSIEVGKIKEMLEDSPENPFHICELSNQVFMSPYHLIRSFKNQTGLTPHQFQMQNRIRKAQCLLQKKSKISEVALTMGFYDQSHFIRWFRKVVGITPTEYVSAQEKLINH